MDIILDTNIIRQKPKLDSEEIRVLVDYLDKTNSKIVLPEVVHKELKAYYEKLVRDSFAAYKSALGSLRNLAPNIEIQDQTFDVDSIAKTYFADIERRLRVSRSSVLPLKAEYLRNVVHRAIYRIPPCSDKGEEIRDALIWLGVLDYARSNAQKMAIFISDNSRQFGKKTLLPSLLEEAASDNLTIQYYNSLSEFIRDQAEKDAKYTGEWLSSVLDIDEINDRFLKVMETSGEHTLCAYAEKRVEDFIDEVEPISSNLTLDTKNFYVYRMSDDSLFVEAFARGDLEIAATYEKRVTKQKWVTRNRYSPISDDYESDTELEDVEDWECKYKYLHPEIVLTIGAVISENKLERFELIGWDYE